jgi:RNA polymerase sigma factor (sigma-70 family)
MEHAFQTTRWSMVRRAVGSDDGAARQALAAICAGYWYPIYAFIRRSGQRPEDAEDLTQGFFARLLEKETLATADPARGKLRSFLLCCVRHYLADQRDRNLALKRGAGLVSSFDGVQAEERYAAEPVDDLSPDRLFQRRWAVEILGEALRQLRAEWTAPDKAALFAALRPFLGFGASTDQSYEELSAQLGLPVGTLKNQVFRLRKRWRELLLELVAETLDEPTPEAIRGELSELLACV